MNCLSLRTVSTLVSVFTLHILLGVKPAQAGHWVVTYKFTTHGDWSSTPDNPATGGPSNSGSGDLPLYPSPNAIAGTLYFLAPIYTTTKMKVTAHITAVFTWTKDSTGNSPHDPPDNSTPPALIFVEESAGASAGTACDVVNSVTADDGLNDPVQKTANSASSSGTHVILVDNSGGSATVEVPAVDLSASVDCHNAPDSLGSMKAVSAGLRYSAQEVRATISSDIEASFFKVGGTPPTAQLHSRESDGGLVTDSSVFWNSSINQWMATAQFTASQNAFANPTYRWWGSSPGDMKVGSIMSTFPLSGVTTAFVPLVFTFGSNPTSSPGVTQLFVEAKDANGNISGVVDSTRSVDGSRTGHN